VKVLFVVPRLDKASSRYRATQYVPYLKRLSIDSEVVALPKGVVARLKLWRACRQFDVVVLQKRLLSWWDLYWIRAYSHKLVFDFDDAIMFSDSGSSGDINRGRRTKFRNIIAKADLVIAGNSYLQQCAQEYRRPLPLQNNLKSSIQNDNDQGAVKVLATPIDLSRYEQKTYQSKKDITIGWIGSRVTLPYLEAIKPALNDLGKIYPNLVLRIVSDQFIESDFIKIERIQWTSENEIVDLQGMDIGIMPLSDNAWTRGKCSFKLLQYMAVGLPVVCSPVGMNKDVVANGVNGLWANNKMQWLQQLSILIEDEALRERMGRAGQEAVKEKYNVEINVKNMAEWFHALSSNP